MNEQFHLWRESGILFVNKFCAGVKADDRKEKLQKQIKECNNIQRQEVYELPLDSVRELIANSVAHRSYLEPGNIQVAIFDDRLEVTSPGMLLNGVSITKMKEGYSKIRNRAIANAFSYMKIIEKWGSGIPRIIRECKEYNLPKPTFIDFDGDFRVNMYRKMSMDTPNGMNGTIGTIGTIYDTNQSDERRILELIKANSSITQSQIKKQTGFSLRTVKRIMAELQSSEIVIRIGNNRSGKWQVKK